MASSENNDIGNNAGSDFLATLRAMDLGWILIGLKTPGKTRAGIARALGLKPPQITRLLQGTRRLKADEVQKIATYLGVDPPKTIPVTKMFNDEKPLTADQKTAKIKQNAAELIGLYGQGPATEQQIGWLAFEIQQLVNKLEKDRK